jgi:riboflavin synthase alpha subunit
MPAQTLTSRQINALCKKYPSENCYYNVQKGYVWLDGKFITVNRFIKLCEKARV